MARTSQSPVPNLSGMPFVERGKQIRLRTARDHQNIMGEVIGLPVAESGGRGEVAVFGGPRAREYRLLFLEAFSIVQERRAQQAEALRLDAQGVPR